MWKKLIGALAVVALSTTLAIAQTNPGLTQGQKLTPAQWNNLFASKQDTLGYTPLNQAGGSMSGRLVTAAPGASTAGFNLTPGTAPGSPSNGDLWVTSTSAFARVNGVTYDLLSPASSGLVVGSSTITGGTNGRVLRNNSGVLSEYAVSGSGNVAMTTSPAFTTPDLGSPSAVGTMPAFTLGGTVSGGGNQINNVVIGNSTPLAGSFTSIAGVSLALTSTALSTLSTTQNPTGSPATSTKLNRFNIQSDNLDAGGGIVNAVAVDHTFGGSSAKGGRTALQAIATLSSSTNASNTYVNHSGATSGVVFNASENGTNTGAGSRGRGIGVNGYAFANNSSATNLTSLTGVQGDVHTATGSSLKWRVAVGALEEGSVVQAAGTTDAAFAASALSGSVNFKFGLLFSDYQGQGPVASTGTLIGTTGSGSVAKGIDWSSYTFSGNQITGVGFSVSNNGSPTFLQYNLAGASSGLVSINPQAAAGTYNFNLPTSAGTAGQPLLSGGGGGSPMTWGSMSTNVPMFFGSPFTAVNSGTTAYFSQGGGDTTEANTSMPAGQAMTIKNLYAVASALPGVGNTWTYTVRKNGADTTLTCQVTNSSTACTPDTTHSFTVVATDLIDIKVVASATVTASVTHKMVVTGVTTSP